MNIIMGKDFEGNDDGKISCGWQQSIYSRRSVYEEEKSDFGTSA